VTTEANIEEDMSKIQAVKQKYEADLLKKKNVVGVGVGFKTEKGVMGDQVAIVVNVKQKVAETELNPQDLVPEMLDNFPVDVVEVGTFRAW
jgi:hypothetical protein